MRGSQPATRQARFPRRLPGKAQTESRRDRTECIEARIAVLRQRAVRVTEAEAVRLHDQYRQFQLSPTMISLRPCGACSLRRRTERASQRNVLLHSLQILQQCSLLGRGETLQQQRFPRTRHLDDLAVN
jgi:hypothetical protein